MRMRVVAALAVLALAGGAAKAQDPAKDQAQDQAPASDPAPVSPAPSAPAGGLATCPIPWRAPPAPGISPWRAGCGAAC